MPLDVDIAALCDLAYRGDFEALKLKVLENPELISCRDTNQRLFLHWAALGGHDLVVEYLLDKGCPVDAKDDIVTLLLQNGADGNIVDKLGATPLHRAASKGNTEVVKMLLNHTGKVDVNVADRYGNTPLHLACEENRTEEARLLVMHSALLDKPNKEKRTALDIAPPALARQLLTLREQHHQ